MQNLTLLHFGDSITYGQYVDPAMRWTALVEERLRACFVSAEIRIVNSGISGDTTRLGLERFAKDAQDLFPAVATIQFGLNDCNVWKTDGGVPRVSERAFVANLVEMIDRLRRFRAREIVLATNHRTLRRSELPSGEAYEDANARYSELIREVAAETDVTLCDIREVFEPFGDEELAHLLLPFPDQLHLSVAGNALYADAIWPFVKRAVTAVLRQEPVLEQQA